MMPGFLLFLFLRTSLDGLLVFFCFVHSYFFAATYVIFLFVFVFFFMKCGSRLVVCHGLFIYSSKLTTSFSLVARV